MKKMLYITNVTKDSKLIGVKKKVKMQKEFFEQNGFKVDTLYLETNNKMKINKILIRLPYISLYDRHSYKLNVDVYDCIYIRKMKLDGQFIKFLKKIKSNNDKVRIIMELPTYPYDNEQPLSLKETPILIKDRYNRRKLFNYVDNIITYSKDKSIFNIPTIQASNVIDFNNINPITPVNTNDKINLIAVASFSEWHGYDRILKGLKKYKYKYKNKTEKREILIHFVGTGKEINRYKEYVLENNLGEDVIFHGVQTGTQLEQIYNKSDIGLDAMGRHRSGVFYNSTLKGKEYGAKGLPIVSGVETELDKDLDYKYYMRVPSDDSPVDIERVISFFNTVYNDSLNRIEIVKQIRKYTQDHFDINKAWRHIIDKMHN